MDAVEVRHYTVREIRDWLVHNKPANGLSNEIIRPALAWALIHHPDVTDEDPVVAAIFDDEKLATSTCAFPEVMVKPAFKDSDGNAKRVWWFPMLWCKPEFRGKGYGLVAVGSLAEVYGMDCAWTVWAVPESIEIFEFLGCKTYYFPRYFMSKNHFPKTRKGRLLSLKQDIICWWQSRRKQTLPNFNYSVRYLNSVDDESYEFIRNNSKENLFLTSQRALNWELHYPWSVSSPLTDRVPVDGRFFQDTTALLQNSFVQVRKDDSIVGVYIMRRTDVGITLDYMYYAKESADIVYSSVVEHILRLRAKNFDTEDGELAEFVQKYIFFPVCKTEKLSLSISPEIQVPEIIVR